MRSRPTGFRISICFDFPKALEEKKMSPGIFLGFLQIFIMLLSSLHLDTSVVLAFIFFASVWKEESSPNQAFPLEILCL
jgi:hypothetical protein